MKKILVMIVVAVMATVNVAAQKDALQLAKEQAVLNEYLMKQVNKKPSKSAKKRAKDLRKDGWKTTSARSVERQLTEAELLEEVLMEDEYGTVYKQYIIHTALTKAETYDVAYANARMSAQVEIASQLTNLLASAAELKTGNKGSKNAESLRGFTESAKSVTKAALADMRPLVVNYKDHPNGVCEIQLTVAFDKKVVSSRLKRKLKEELEMEADLLDELVNSVMRDFK